MGVLALPGPRDLSVQTDRRAGCSEKSKMLILGQTCNVRTCGYTFRFVSDIRGLRPQVARVLAKISKKQLLNLSNVIKQTCRCERRTCFLKTFPLVVFGCVVKGPDPVCNDRRHSITSRKAPLDVRPYFVGGFRVVSTLAKTNPQGNPFPQCFA